MALGDASGRGVDGLRMVTVAVSAELVWQLVSANLSSPQTAELNAEARAPTIAKWVNLSTAEAVVWLLFLCYLDKSLWPAVGGLAAGVSMWLKYRYAINSGLKNDAPPTESYT
jgi:hypothetical protein